MIKKLESDGLSLWYRFTWRVKYTVLTFYGPPRLAGRLDPLTRMEQDRAAMVAKREPLGEATGQRTSADRRSQT